MSVRYKLIGRRFGKLLVTDCLGSRKGKNGKSGIFWKCLCDCGTITEIRTSHLMPINGTRSCGCLNPYHPLPEGEASFNQVFYRYKRQATQRGIKDFLLTKEEFRELIVQNCFYCGSSSFSVQESKDSNGSFTYTGIDRVDSLQGYIMDNCVPCCKICNIMKRSLSVSEFYNHIEKIYNHSVVSAVS